MEGRMFELGLMVFEESPKASAVVDYYILVKTRVFALVF